MCNVNCQHPATLYIYTSIVKPHYHKTLSDASDSTQQAKRYKVTNNKRKALRTRYKQLYGDAGHHGIATELQGRWLGILSPCEIEGGDRRPAKGGSYVAFKAPLRRARSTLTDAPRGLSSTHV